MNHSNSSGIEHRRKQERRNALFEREKQYVFLSLERSKIFLVWNRKLLWSEVCATGAQASLRPDPTTEGLQNEQVILILLK